MIFFLKKYVFIKKNFKNFKKSIKKYKKSVTKWKKWKKQKINEKKVKKVCIMNLFFKSLKRMKNEKWKMKNEKILFIKKYKHKEIIYFII